MGILTNNQNDDIRAQHKVIKLVLVVFTPEELPVSTDLDSFQLEGFCKMPGKPLVCPSIGNKHRCLVRRYRRRNCGFGLG
jgi:hypothetical protein